MVYEGLYAYRLNFYPRPPGGGRLLYLLLLRFELYFYPRPPGGGRLLNKSVAASSQSISIHALRVEGDRHTRYSPALCVYFYPRPPGGGRPFLRNVKR